MRVLVVTTDLPFPPTWGAAIRNYQFLRALADGHRVDLVTYEDPERAEGARELERLGVTVRLVPRAASSKRLAQLASMLSPRSHLGGRFHQPALQRAIDETLARRRPDVVLVEGSPLMRLDFRGRPVVLDEHNVEYEVLQRTYQSESSPLRTLFGRLEYRKFRREEQAAWRRATRVVVTSDRERNLMRRDGATASISTIANGVDLGYLRPAGEEAAEAGAIVFTGRIDYRPNTDAVIWFVRDVLPLIRERRPDAVLRVVGAGVPPEVARLAGPGVEIVGRVPDMRPWWRRAAVAVVPIRFGGGTRLKVVEAMAMGRAVVSTSLGCEGIDLVPGEHLLVADAPSELAEAVLLALDDPELRASLGRRGRSLVEAAYSWPALAARMEAVLREAADGGERTAPSYTVTSP